MTRVVFPGRLACALLLCAGPAVGETPATAVPATPPAVPTRVAASFFFGTIENVDSVTETFNADFYLLLGWDDPRLAGLSPEQMADAPIWRPKVEMVNSRDLQQPWEPYIRSSGPGKVGLQSRFHGTFAAPMDLHDFPFDHQVLPVEVESLGLTARQMVFSYPGNRHEGRGWTVPQKTEEVLGNSVRLPEWKIEGIQVRERDMYYKFMDASYSRYRIEVMVSRRSGFYVWKVIAVEAMIVVLSWLVFLMDAGEIGNRSAVAVTLLLATVAFSYVVSGITPRISYLTLLDWFLLGCFVLIFLSALETALVYLLQRRGTSSAVTARIDRWSLAAFPSLFLLFNLLLWAPVLA
jgi:hypothetical protein